jgi:hypothetical protein
MGCRYGYVDRQADVAASLFTQTRHGEIFGRILDRAEAMKSARIDDFWALTDWLVTHDSLLQRTVYQLPRLP